MLVDAEHERKYKLIGREVESNFSTLQFRHAIFYTQCSTRNVLHTRALFSDVLPIQKLQHLRNSLTKIPRWRDQAYDQVSIAGEIVKMPRVDEHGKLAQDFNRQVFVGLGHGNP